MAIRMGVGTRQLFFKVSVLLVIAIVSAAVIEEGTAAKINNEGTVAQLGNTDYILPVTSTADDFDETLSILDDYPHLNGLLSALNALAYVHLLYLTSRSRSYVVETIQLLAFACFPTLPFIQFIHNAFKTAVDVFYGARGYVRYYLASLAGTYVFKPDEEWTSWNVRHRIGEVPRPSLERHKESRKTAAWSAELLAILSNLAASVLSLMIYVQKPMRSDYDTKPIGQDQRGGWTALGGTIAASLTLTLHLCSVKWSIKQDYEPEENASLMWESEVFTEIVLAALLQDFAVAYAGGAYSLVGTFMVFMANRVILVLIFIAVVLFNKYIRQFARFLLGPKRRWTALRPLYIVFSLAICVGIVTLQVFTAISEHMGYERLQDMIEEAS